MDDPEAAVSPPMTAARNYEMDASTSLGDSVLRSVAFDLIFLGPLPFRAPRVKSAFC